MQKMCSINAPTGTIGKAEGLEPIAAFETRKPRFGATAFDAPKERRKSEINLLKRPALKRNGIGSPCRVGAKLGYTLALVKPRSALAGFPIAVYPLGQRGIVKIAGVIQGGAQLIMLPARGEQPHLVSQKLS